MFPQAESLLLIFKKNKTMERKFKRTKTDAPLGELGDRSKPKDFDLEKDTLNQKNKEKDKDNKSK